MAQARTGDGVTIWYEIEGRGDPVVLLPGRGDSSDLYPSCFTDRLTEAGYGVVRMDPRDTGLSGDGGDEYTMCTLADDVVTVLDHAGLERAHAVGLSMGGIILTDLASRRADRVLSCTFLAAMSPDPDAGIGPRFFAGLDETDAVASVLESMGAPTEDDRRWVEQELELATRRAPGRPEAGARHQAAAFRFGWPELGALHDIRVPALAIHGDTDQSLPVTHALAFEREIRDGRAVIIDGMGHLPTRHEWDEVARLVIDHLQVATDS